MRSERARSIITDGGIIANIQLPLGSSTMETNGRPGSNQPRPFSRTSMRLSSQPFPFYRHLPGVTPHPRRHPAGHSYGESEVPAQKFDPSNWPQTPDYLQGVDLYNFAYYWEAHEAWEGIWKTTERNDVPGAFLQGLIQISAALLKREMQVWGGMNRLSRAGTEKLRRVHSRHNCYCGINLGDFLLRLETIFSAPIHSGWTADPRIRLDIPQLPFYHK